MDVRLPRLLDAQLGEVVRLHPVSMSIEDNLTPLSTASMTLAEGEHVRLHDWLELYTDRGSAGIFRVRSVTETYTAESSVEMEHGACVLGDAILPGEGTLSGTPGEIVTQILARQTMRVAGRVPWVFGSSAASGAQSFDYDNNNILSALIELVESIDGYALDFDQSVFPWHVNIIRKETTPSCEGRLSRNLRSVSVTLDDSELCTRIYCDKLPATGYIDGPNSAIWGVICKTISATDDVTQESLTDYIRRYLEDHKDPKVSIEIDADDFSTVTGEPIDRFVKGRLFRLALPDYGVTLEERILSVRTGSVYGDKYNVRLTLANNIRDTAQNFVRIDNAIGSGVGKNSTGRYVSGRGGGGTGLSQTTVLDMLKKTETYITADEAWTREAGVKIESNASGLYATKKSIFGNAFGDVETIDALIQASSDNGGIVSMIVGRKNSVEDVKAGIGATAAGGGLITIKANQKDLDDVENRVSGAEIDLKGKEQRINALAGTLDEQGELIKGVQLDLNGQNQTITSLAGTVDKQAGLIEGVQTKLSGQDKTITAMAGTISSQGELIDGVSLRLDGIDKEIELKADKILLNGYVTASQLSAEIAKVNQFFAGNATAAKMVVTNLSALSLTVEGNKVKWTSMEVVTSVSGRSTGEIAVRGADGSIAGTALTGYRVTYGTDMIYYLSW